MFGLLGTVFGMIRAFSSIAYKVEFGKPLLLASAISEAMVTTAGGLTVGIFSMILFFYFHSKTNKIIHDMEAGSEGIADAINMAISKLSITHQTAPSKIDAINVAMSKLDLNDQTDPSKKGG
jgi:biopolymer transport protein ExbB/TolQ